MGHVKCRTRFIKENKMKVEGTHSLATANPVPVVPAKPANRTVPASLRVPVTESNRESLRALRARESAQWENRAETPRQRGTMALLRAQVAQVEHEKRKEGWFYGLLACMSAAVVGYTLWDSCQAFENWASFVQYVHGVIGGV